MQNRMQTRAGSGKQAGILMIGNLKAGNIGRYELLRTYGSRIGPWLGNTHRRIVKQAEEETSFARSRL